MVLQIFSFCPLLFQCCWLSAKEFIDNVRMVQRIVYQAPRPRLFQVTIAGANSKMPTTGYRVQYSNKFDATQKAQLIIRQYSVSFH